MHNLRNIEDYILTVANRSFLAGDGCNSQAAVLVDIVLVVMFVFIVSRWQVDMGEMRPEPLCDITVLPVHNHTLNENSTIISNQLIKSQTNIIIRTTTTLSSITYVQK